MNQEKIGKLIVSCRKMKRMTQTELAEKLGVSDRTVGNWENGRNMPDLALLNPLCKALDLNLNELLNGELLEKENDVSIEKTLNITLDYSQKIINKKDKYLGLLMLLFGLILNVFSGIFYYTRNHARAYIYLIGIYFAMIGLNKILISFKKSHHLLIAIIFAFVLLSSSFAYDYYKVSRDLDSPMWAYQTDGMRDDVILYKTLFYNYYVVHQSESYNIYTVFDAKKEYNLGTLKIYPFTPQNSLRELQKCSGDIECIVKTMPLEMNYKSDENNKKILFFYEENAVKPRYLIDIKKAILYNSLVIFLLTDYDNIEFEITYNHDVEDPKYITTREKFTSNLLVYDELTNNLTEENFYNLFERELTQEYVKYYFSNLFTTDTIFDDNGYKFEG